MGKVEGDEPWSETSLRPRSDMLTEGLGVFVWGVEVVY